MQQFGATRGGRAQGIAIRAFRLDRDSNITIFTPGQEPGELNDGTLQFDSERQFAEVAEHWAARRLVDIWNQNNLGGGPPVNRFTDRKTALARIWMAVQGTDGAVRKPAVTVAPQRVMAARKASNKRVRRRAGRKNTKLSHVIALLERPAGATLRVLMKATGWQAHSVAASSAVSCGRSSADA